MRPLPIWSVLFIAIAPAALVWAAAPRIELANYRDGDEIRHSVPIIRGQIADPKASAISITNLSSSRPTRQLAGVIHNGQFKVLADLVGGENRLVIKAGPHEARLTLRFRPQTNPYLVRAIYLTDNTGDTIYQAPDPNAPQDYAGRLGTALLLMQSFTAERMNDLGFGRRTFNVELDENGKVVVHVHKGKLAAQEYWSLADQAWYAKINKELAGPFPMKQAKNFAVAAYTRYDPETKKSRGHTALGGGGLGLFGSGNLYTWPARLEDVHAAFMDPRPIDTTKTMNDSAGRNNHWGAASTTIGACLHEMGHTFGLPHTREPLDIMTRGFDRFNRAFTFIEPWNGKPPTEFKPERVACFAPISASCLMTSRWFALDKHDWQDGRPTIRREKSGGDIVIEDSHAIRYVNFSVKGDSVHFIAPPAGQKKVVIRVAEIKEKVSSEEFRVRAINDQGNSAAKDSGELKGD